MLLLKIGPEGFIWLAGCVGLTNLGPILSKSFSKSNKISQTNNESCVGKISIWMILVLSKCSIYDVKNPIFLIFGVLYITN